MDKQSKAPGVYRVILCVLTLVLAPVFYAIWQPYNTSLLQLPAAGGVWQLLTRLLFSTAGQLDDRLSGPLHICHALWGGAARCRFSVRCQGDGSAPGRGAVCEYGRQ